VALSKRLAHDLEQQMPFLISEGYEVKSIATGGYNCIAFAAEDEPSVNWWPDDGDNPDGYRPISRRELTLDCFVEMFASLGYEKCDNGSLESGYEKIVIYLFEGTPSHAARQLADGRWKSKLGRAEDIEHNTVKAVEDESCYGTAAQYMRRLLT
jgi:hypothetical protein